jgi:hypothetical protein
VRVPRHEDVNLGPSALSRHRDEGVQVALQRRQLVPQPQAHVRGNLVVAAAGGMGASEYADDADEHTSDT